MKEAAATTRHEEAHGVLRETPDIAGNHQGSVKFTTKS
jgi:hypothetical protein